MVSKISPIIPRGGQAIPSFTPFLGIYLVLVPNVSLPQGRLPAARSFWYASFRAFDKCCKG